MSAIPLTNTEKFQLLKKPFWYTDSSNTPIGPIAFKELNKLYSAGLIQKETMIIEEGGAEFPSNLSGGTVAVGEVPSDLPLPSPSQAAGSALFVYHPDSASPEKTEETIQGNHLTAIVHRSPPIRWADDVQAQQLLFRLIEKTNPSHE